MTCDNCGQRCPGRLCKTCRLTERQERLEFDTSCDECGAPVDRFEDYCDDCDKEAIEA